MPATKPLPTSASVAVGDLPLTNGVLLATLGGTDSDTAARLAYLFACRTGTPVEALTVMEPLPADLLAYAPSYGDVDQDRRDALIESVRSQLRRMALGDTVPLVVQDGPAAECIAGRAKARGAALIAMGIGRHETANRIFGVEPAIAVLHRTAVPLLATTPKTHVPARSIVIATDFSPAAERSARLAVAFAAEDATIHFVHAWPWMDLGGSGAPTWFRVYESGVTTLVEELVQSLRLPPTMHVVTHLEHGEAIAVINQLAATQSADIIALGSHGRGLVDRLTLGSVAEGVLRKAHCSVLIAPPTPSEKE